MDRRTLSILIVLVLVLAAPAWLRADEGAAVAEAKKAATSWLATVDAGRYEKSWDDAAALFRQAVTKDAWEHALNAAREPLGAVVERKLKSATFARELPGAPDGEYVVIQFDTRFANKASAVETITPMRDPDGVWRVSGYLIR